MIKIYMRIFQTSLYLFYLNSILLASTPSTLIMDGELTPDQSIHLVVPSLLIFLKDSGMGRNRYKLTFLKEEGTAVKKGEKVAEFELDLERLKSHLERKTANAKIERMSEIRSAQSSIEVNQVMIDKAKIALSKLEADLVKKEIWSERNFGILKADINITQAAIAAWEATAIKRQEYLKSVIKYHDTNVGLWEESQQYLKKHLEKKNIKAPANGLLTYAKLPWGRGKPKVNDWIKSGWTFLKISTGKKLNVRFYLPERHLERLKINDMLSARIKGSEKSFPVRVLAIEPFPEMMGSIEGDFSTNYATQKMFVVQAEVLSEIGGIAGQEVEVTFP